MPLALATGIGSTFDCADHSNSVCLRVRSTISWPVMDGVAIAVVMIKNSFASEDEVCSRLDSQAGCRYVSLLELAAVLLCPAFDDYFLIGVKLDGIAALSMQIAEEAVLPSAERKIGHGRGDADVDADVYRRRFVTETSRSRPARGEQRRLVSVSAAFEKAERVI